jgi:hypothetical protein|uniref:Uncharacterized protein n=1 Tax=viral metagenome TaxID=1070528 RepID=A0A6C0IWH4_9ZZZZ
MNTFDDGETIPLTQYYGMSAHGRLFAESSQLTLRATNENSDIKSFEAIQLDNLPKRSGWFSQRKTIRLTELETDYLQKPTAILELVEDKQHMALYRGSMTAMGYHTSYELRIRTDVDFNLRRRNIIAIAEVIRTERLEGIAAMLGLHGQICVFYDTYNIYFQE